VQPMKKASRLFDTAEFYGPYINEELVGGRGNLFATSRYRNKFGFDMKSAAFVLKSRPEHIGKCG